jgi:suppressor for copper-sensitivity B
MKIRTILAIQALAAVCLSSLISVAAASTGPWFQGNEARVRLISATTATGDLSDIKLGLEFELNPGWKIYWRSPGDAGIPPETDWSGSSNLAKTKQNWPVPERFSAFGLDTFGYGKEIIFPVTASLSEPSKPLSLKAEVNYLICDDICVPGQASLTLDLPAGEAKSSSQLRRINHYQSLVPKTAAHQGFTVNGISSSPVDGNGTITVEVASIDGLQNPDIIAEGPEGFFYGKPVIDVSEDKRTATLSLPVEIPSYIDEKFEDSSFVLTIFDGARGFETSFKVGDSAVTGAIENNTTATPEALLLTTWFYLIGIALLGGFILNLMPCVLPVLSIKVMSALGHSRSSNKEIRTSFFYTGLGIVASFLLLAVGAIALKMAGHSVGWGIQFQQPLFILFMVLIITLFAANLLGLFEITLPGSLSNWAATAGQGESNGSFGKNFSTGVLATLLATPCSAPFLGTAIAFALSRGPVEIMIIFLALGIGMALPYILVMLVPSAVRLLPKPGGWMEKLRFVLGLALLATVIWLLWILGGQIGQIGLIIAASIVVLMLLVFWLGKSRNRSFRLTAGLLAVGLFVMPMFAAQAPTAPTEVQTTWLKFDQERIKELVSDGKVVFVDVTADWCLTCKVNKKLVLDSEKVLTAFGAADIVTMRADWTNPDPAIAAYLASHGRYGIPFNIVYGPGAPNGKPLPELLSTASVLSAINDGRSL